MVEVLGGANATTQFVGKRGLLFWEGVMRQWLIENAGPVKCWQLITPSSVYVLNTNNMKIKERLQKAKYTFYYECKKDDLSWPGDEARKSKFIQFKLDFLSLTFPFSEFGGEEERASRGKKDEKLESKKHFRPVKQIEAIVKRKRNDNSRKLYCVSHKTSQNLLKLGLKISSF